MDLFNKSPDLLSISFDDIKKTALECKNCSLHETRTQVVFGEGPVPCDLMLIGEGPGEQEDLTGRPFIGKAGQLLTKILESVGINRETDIYIANTVKCRPPNNRTPLDSETQACWPYLEAQIKFINPKIILLAGAPACKVILKTSEAMSKIRGQWFKLPGNSDIHVMPIFHPSFLLRNQQKTPGSPKWLTWQDMQEVKNALGFIKKVKSLEKNR